MKVLVLAGGFDQIALIKELQNRGHEVLLADYFHNPPAKKYANKHVQVSTLDEDSIYRLSVEEEIDLLTTACTDQALLIVARVSDRLGLPCYIDSETARSVTDKVYMKKKFVEHGIPTASSILLENGEAYVDEIPSKLKFPLIVKPCDCNSSKGVVKVTDKEELMPAVQQAFQLSRSKKVIIETFMEGEEVSIDIWKDREGAKVISVSRTCKITANAEHFTICRSEYPIIMTDTMKQKIQYIAEKICYAFNLENCPVLVQAIITEDDIDVIEFSARIGGGSKYKLIEYMSGVNIMQIYVNRILGDTTQIIVPEWSNKFVELNYVYAYNGVFDTIAGFDKALSSGEICEVFLYKNQGTKIEKHTTSSDRIAGFLIQEESCEKLKQKRYHVLEKMDILDDCGNSIMYKECFY